MPSNRRVKPATSGRARRVPRNTLSRDRIVEAALALLDEQGFDAVTMPSLAKRLGVGTMSLYRHVADKDDLIDAVAVRVLSGVAVPNGDADDWKGRVVGYLRGLRAATLAHPALSPSVGSRSGPSSISSRGSMPSYGPPGSPTWAPSGPSTRC